MAHALCSASHNDGEGLDGHAGSCGRAGAFSQQR